MELRTGSRKKYISADLFSFPLSPTRLCSDACAAPHFSKSLYVPSMLASRKASSDPLEPPYDTLYSLNRVFVHEHISLGRASIASVGTVIPRFSCQLSTSSPWPLITTSKLCFTGTRMDQSPSRRCLAPGLTRMRATGKENTSCGAVSDSGAGCTITRHSGCASTLPSLSSRTTSSAPGEA